MRTLTGGSKQKSKSTSQSTSNSIQTSENLAFPMLSEQYQPAIRQGNDAMSTIYSLLGLGGDAGAANRAFDTYRGSTDYDFTTREGTKAITNSNAASGMLNSGDTLKRLQEFGQGQAQKYFGDFLARLLGLAESGQRAGSLVSGAGGFSRGESNSQSTGMNQSSGSSSGGLTDIFNALKPSGS